jgi:quinol monooxygenase YgiN
MIIVLGVFEVEAGDRDRFLEQKAAQVTATRAETGCIDYAFAADAADAGRVRLVERWESMADLEAHVAALRSAPPATAPPVPSRTVAVDVLDARVVRAPWA